MIRVAANAVIITKTFPATVKLLTAVSVREFTRSMIALKIITIGIRHILAVVQRTFAEFIRRAAAVSAGTVAINESSALGIIEAVAITNRPVTANKSCFRF